MLRERPRAGSAVGVPIASSPQHCFERSDWSCVHAADDYSCSRSCSCDTRQPAYKEKQIVGSGGRYGPDVGRVSHICSVENNTGPALPIPAIRIQLRFKAMKASRRMVLKFIGSVLVSRSTRFSYRFRRIVPFAPAFWRHNPKFPNRIQASTNTLAGACQ